jgi:hypothetical protein
MLRGKPFRLRGKVYFPDNVLSVIVFFDFLGGFKKLKFCVKKVLFALHGVSQARDGSSRTGRSHHSLRQH